VSRREHLIAFLIGFVPGTTVMTVVLVVDAVTP
jgi:hypothetical protein